jgi:hypothetical protein
VAAIAVKDDCVRQALFAFSTAYILDYEPSDEMRIRANRHYRAAVQLLERSLKNEATYDVGREDSVVVAIILILSNDVRKTQSRAPYCQALLCVSGGSRFKQIVNWECRRDRGQILDQTDPTHRYWKAQNIQSSSARIGNANWIAYTEICAQAVTPLAEESTKGLFPWLLGGSNDDVHKIQGVTGVCPKLLHIFSQITHLAALLRKVSD